MAKLESLVIDPETGALIVVDVQNDFCAAEQGCSYFQRQQTEKRDDLTAIQETIDDHLIPFITRSRESGLFIVYLQSAYEEGQFSDMPKLCLEGTKGWELYKVGPDSNNGREIVANKDAHNPFQGDNSLNQFLRENLIRTLMISGVTTDNCVAATTYASLGMSYRPIILADCVSTAGYKIKTAHAQTLKEFGAHPVVKLINSTDITFR